MNFKTVLTVLALALIVTSVPTGSAHATTASEALSRMDQIIKEMQTLRTEFALLVGSASTAVSTPQVLGAATSNILSDDLSYGATNASITRIQKLLATDSDIYPDGTVSGFFGPKTQEAIRQFQSRFGLDTVGVVGPSTKAILEAFMSVYPTENYPVGLLKQAIPKVQGASTSVVSTPVTTVPTNSSGRTFRNITIEEDYNEFVIRSSYSDGTRFGDFVVSAEDEAELVTKIAKKLGISEASVKNLADISSVRFGKASNSGDKSDAADAIDEAKSDLSDAKDEINAADDDGDDVSDAQDYYDEARTAYKDARSSYSDEEYSDAIDYANDAIKLVKKAIKALP